MRYMKIQLVISLEKDSETYDKIIQFFAEITQELNVLGTYNSRERD